MMDRYFELIAKKLPKKDRHTVVDFGIVEPGSTNIAAVQVSACDRRSVRLFPSPVSMSVQLAPCCACVPDAQSHGL
jgi:hypothetical protein